jgi:hypothetical protein
LIEFRGPRILKITYIEILHGVSNAGRMPGCSPRSRLFFSTRTALVAENLFLRKQLAMFREREIKPKRSTLKRRLAMVMRAWFFNWRNALVKPAMFVKWHRKRFPSFVAMEISQARPARTPAKLARTDT